MDIHPHIEAESLYLHKLLKSVFAKQRLKMKTAFGVQQASILKITTLVWYKTAQANISTCINIQFTFFPFSTLF